MSGGRGMSGGMSGGRGMSGGSERVVRVVRVVRNAGLIPGVLGGPILLVDPLVDLGVLPEPLEPLDRAVRIGGEVCVLAQRRSRAHDRIRDRARVCALIRKAPGRAADPRLIRILTRHER